MIHTLKKHLQTAVHQLGLMIELCNDNKVAIPTEITVAVDEMLHDSTLDVAKINIVAEYARTRLLYACLSSKEAMQYSDEPWFKKQCFITDCGVFIPVQYLK